MRAKSLFKKRSFTLYDEPKQTPCDNTNTEEIHKIEYSIARTRAQTPRNLRLTESLEGPTILEIIAYFQRENPDIRWSIENENSTTLYDRE